MKQTFLIIGLIIIVSFTVIAQPPSWENEITLSAAITGATSTTSDGYGQHLVGVYSNVVKHYLVGNDGVIIYNTLSVTDGQMPTVTSYGGKVRVTMKLGSDIKIYQSTNGGSTWLTTFTYPNPGVPIYSLDSYSDVIGTHIVWENNSDQNKTHEIYYVRYDDRISNWQDFKNVTDLSSPAAGGRPSVTATSNKAHVGFAGANYQLTTRDLNLTTHVWDANYKTESSTDHPIAISNLASIGDYVYSVSVSDLIVGGGCSRVYFYTSRHADDASWQYQFPLGGACVGDVGGQRYIQTNSGTLWFLQKSDYLYLRSYIPGVGWYDYEQVTQTSNPSSHHISASQFGIYCFWEYLEINGITYSMMRRKPTTVTGSFTQNAFLTGNNWLSGSSIGVPSGKTVEARSGSITNIMANSVFSYQGTLNLNAGSTLNMFEGSRINFGYGKALTVNGNINAQGSSSSHITLASTTRSRGYWEKIQLNSGTNTFRYCDIKFADMGIVLNNTSNNTIEYCTFDSCRNYGVQAISPNRNKGACIIRSSTFTNNPSRGISVVNGRADISSSSFSTNGEALLLYPNALVFIDHSNVQNSTVRGSKIYGVNSSLYFCPDNFSSGGNNFYENFDEVYISTNGWAYIGNYDAVKDIQYGGDNTFTNHPSKLVYNVGRDCVPARRNCWITNSSIAIFGCVDTTYRIICATLQLFSNGNTPTDNDMVQLIGELRLAVEKNTDEALNALRQLDALVGPGSRYQDALGIAWEDFLIYIQHDNKAALSLKSLAASLYINSLLYNQEYYKVIALIDKILAENPDDELWIACYWDKMVAYTNILEIDNAKSVLESVKNGKRKIEPEMIAAMEEYLLAFDSDGIAKSTARYQANIEKIEYEKPASFILYQNYPNPFNPVTTIEYSLPEDSKVLLKVYNVLGQELKTLVDEFQSAGVKLVSFNSGELPSGVYFYRIQAGPFTDIKKMIFAR